MILFFLSFQKTYKPVRQYHVFMIAIISDTHENVSVVEKAVAMIRKFKPSLVVHCGDLISPAMLGLFKDFEDFRLVFGNNDADIFKHLKFFLTEQNKN